MIKKLLYDLPFAIDAVGAVKQLNRRTRSERFGRFDVRIRRLFGAVRD